MSLPFVRTFCVAVLAAVTGLSAEPLRWEASSGHRSAAVAPAQPGRTGFTLLSAAQTGVHFTNTLSMEAAAKNHNLMQSAGVAAGDFDGDGFCDLYFCNVEGRNSLYRNLGSFHFADVTESAGAATPKLFSTGAIFADVNATAGSTCSSPPTTADQRFCSISATDVSRMRLRPAGFPRARSAALPSRLPIWMATARSNLFVANYGENTILRTAAT